MKILKVLCMYVRATHSLSISPSPIVAKGLNGQQYPLPISQCKLGCGCERGRRPMLGSHLSMEALVEASKVGSEP